MKLNYGLSELEKVANNIRINTVRSIHEAGSGHPGGSLSIADILSVLYFREMNIDPENPGWSDRDRFVLSKGHAAPAYYAALAQRGFFPEEQLDTLRKIDSPLQGHPDRNKIPGVDMSTGSLGQGISAAAGMACYAKKTGGNFRVYTIIGDGEMQEGEVWEAMMAAPHLGLSNLTVFLDNNNLQIDGQVDYIMSIYPIREKAEAFGWNVLEIDGHDVGMIIHAVEAAKAEAEKPTFIICKTIKGKGVSFMENEVGWHGSAISDKQFQMAMNDLT